MGKTPNKKAVPGGDERNLYVRRLKATTSVSTKVCDTSSAAKRREPDNPNRVGAIGVQKRLPGTTEKVFKSKLQSPAPTKTHSSMKNPPRFQAVVSKDDKKPATAASKVQGTCEIPPTMQPDSEESAVQLKVSITKSVAKESARLEAADVVAKDETASSRTSTNGNVPIERTEAEKTAPSEHVANQPLIKNDKNKTEEPSTDRKARENGNESGETAKNEVEMENPSSDFVPLKLEEESPNDIGHNGDCDQAPNNEIGNEEKALVAESKKEITENVVESTTSEPSDSGIASQVENNPNDRDKDNDAAENDPSFVSYDSSIMLKNVQIKLNDCLKDNSKLFDVSIADDSCNDTADKRHDMSFGKTLRNISGRSTINRLRYVTVREQRFSPNSSLFVNTSRASIDPEDPASCGLTRFPTDLSDALICNEGSASDRKRKIVSDAIESAKKLKTETAERGGGGSFLDTSLEMLKSIRRPVRVSTPNIKGYNFGSARCNEKAFSDDKSSIDADTEPKKWCIVM